ncbi:ubiquitin-conjugating enzyme E2 Q2-like [Papio anubis]|uniref:ubiquitin-conjugating enzyme E2 Q2-like n=1 Tax=Papio anubis TaxID=9555 RepID=UPI0012AD42EB|nr:ubiquitin-conjugating enzyme E2 Q2-like [Papio anubis]
MVQPLNEEKLRAIEGRRPLNVCSLTPVGGVSYKGSSHAGRYTALRQGLDVPLAFSSRAPTREDVRVRVQGQAEVTGLCLPQEPEAAAAHAPLTHHCNITESYSSSSLIWFVDSDEPNLMSVLERLEDTKNNNLNRTTEEVTSKEKEEEMAEDIEDLDHYEMKEEPINGKKLKDEGIEKENWAILEKIRKTERQDHLNVLQCLGQCKLQIDL